MMMNMLPSWTEDQMLGYIENSNKNKGQHCPQQENLSVWFNGGRICWSIIMVDICGRYLWSIFVVDICGRLLWLIIVVDYLVDC